MARHLAGSLASFPNFFTNAFTHLSPGGVLEVHDITYPIQSYDGTVIPSSPIFQWSNLLAEGTIKLGRPLNLAGGYKPLLKEAGFVDIKKVTLKWPINRWPKDKKHKELGIWNQESFLRGLQGFSLALLTRSKEKGGYGWSMEEMETFLVGVRKDIKDVRVYSYFPYYVWTARKPE